MRSDLSTHIAKNRSQARSKGVLFLSSVVSTALLADDDAAPRQLFSLAAVAMSKERIAPTLPHDAAACKGISPSQSLSHTASGYACQMQVVEEYADMISGVAAHGRLYL